MFTLILIITLISWGSGHRSTTVAPSQGEYRFQSYQKCQDAAKLILADERFKEVGLMYRQAYCVEE